MCYSIANFFSFFDSFAYIGFTKPRMFQKNIQKYVFDIKFPALSNAAGMMGLNIEEKLENGKDPLFLFIFKYFQIDFRVSSTIEK